MSSMLCASAAGAVHFFRIAFQNQSQGSGFRDLPERLPIDDPEMPEALRHYLNIARIFMGMPSAEVALCEPESLLKVKAPCVSLALQSKGRRVVVTFTSSKVHYATMK